MLAEQPPKSEEKSAPETPAIVTVVSYEEAKRLGDALLLKYRKAFEALKDK